MSELAVVVLEMTDGQWRPSQVFTREWHTFEDGSAGWHYCLFDGSWCRRDTRLHLHKAGAGGPYVNSYVAANTKPGRIWTAPDQVVVDGWGHRDEKGNPRPLTDAELGDMGYERTAEHPGDIFAYASDDATSWCEKCEDNIPRHSNPCDHLVTCWHCQASYTADDDEEQRCPDCNESQHECDCGEQAGEMCISCGQWTCKNCWPGHAAEPGGPCERGSSDWKEPA